MQKVKRVINTELLDKVRSLGCIVCQDRKEPQIYRTEVHHLKTKKTFGDDVEWNLIPLCVREHRILHTIGLTTFSRKHRVVWDLLIQMNWELDELSGRWIHPES